jgi:iron complex outermembrane receptor protein
MKQQLLVTCAVSLSVWSMSANVSAQTAAASATPAPAAVVLEEITITAEHRVADAQHSAISVSVIGGDELAGKGITSTHDLVNAVPGLDLTHANANSNITLRGLAAGGSTQFADPVVSLNVGGVPLSRQFAALSAMYDLQRVEVLKGPQGTLYGRNATVGAMNLIPNRPDHEFGGSAGMDFGNYHQIRTTGVINAPLTDKVAARLAVATNRRDGYLSNGYDDADNQAARLSVLFEPNDTASLLVWADYFRDNSKGPNTVFRYVIPGQQWQVPDNPWFSFGPAGCGTPALCPAWSNSAGPPMVAPYSSQSVVGDNGYDRISQQIYAAQLDWKLGFGSLTIIPAHVNTDVDFYTYSGGLTFRNRTKANQNSLEARLASNSDGKWRWLAGAFYYREAINAENDVLEPNGYQQILSPDLKDESKAVFGELTYSLIDKLRLTAGARYTSEDKSQDGYTILDGAFTATTCPAPGVAVAGPTTNNGFPYPVGYCQVPNAGTLSFTDSSWKLGIEFDLASQSLLYANARTGFKAGGFAAGLPPNTYKPEKLTAYEIGTKNRFLDNRLQVNLELFDWKYKDQQISVLQLLHPAGQSGYPVNVPGWARGAEINVQAAVTAADRLGLDMLYETSEYELYPTAVSSAGTIGGLTNYPRVNTPKWSGTATAEHSFAFGGSGAQLVLSGSSHFASGVWLRPIAVALLTPGDYREAYTVTNFDLRYEAPNQRWSAAIYVNNVTNRAVVGTGTAGTVSLGTFYRPSTNAAGARYASLEPPRTYGLRFNMKFK